MESNLKKGYQEAYRIACGGLGKKDPVQISLNTDAYYDKDAGCLKVRFLNHAHSVSFPDGQVTREDGAEVPDTVKTLILHYLLHAEKTQPTGKLISFREVRGGGMNYYSVFCKRAVFPLQKAFESETEKLFSAASGLGGTIERYGDASVTIPVFPLVPVTYVVWGKDEENPSSASILFDSGVTAYLPCEDIVLAASFGAYELIRRKS